MGALSRDAQHRADFGRSQAGIVQLTAASRASRALRLGFGRLVSQLTERAT